MSAANQAQPKGSAVPPTEVSPNAAKPGAPSHDGPAAETRSPGVGVVSPPKRSRQLLVLLLVVVALAVSGYLAAPAIRTAMNTVSTDDAYVNGHATFLAARVSGQVSRVLVDDNMRVKRGDVLVQLDKEPYQVQVAIKEAIVETAERDLTASRAQVRGLASQARSNRFRLQHAMEDVQQQLAVLRSNVAQLKVEQANLDLAERDFVRAEALLEKRAIGKQDFDKYVAGLEVARNRVNSAEQTIQQTRAGLGLPIDREKPLEVPADLTQTFSAVREALGAMYNSVTQLGFMPSTWDGTPQQAIDEFYKQDPEKNLDKIYEKLIREAPTVKQAEARLLQVRHDLELAQLNLRYCDVVSEIDGVVARRNVNPGNNVQAGQALMAVRSLTEIWVDANFKETQLADLRIGHRVRCEVDMYGRRREFEGRITGFNMGTGQTLSLLPPQNATGNFVKIIQRLPVRIELTDYDPEKDPLFVGLSVVPYVYFKEKPEGANAGQLLNPLSTLPSGRPVSDDGRREDTADNRD